MSMQRGCRDTSKLNTRSTAGAGSPARPAGRQSGRSLSADAAPTFALLVRSENPLAAGPFRAYCGADYAGLLFVLDDLDRVALQRAHLHHLLEVVLQQRHIDEAHIEAS